MPNPKPPASTNGRAHRGPSEAIPALAAPDALQDFRPDPPRPEPVLYDRGRLPQAQIPPASSGRIQRRYNWVSLPEPYADMQICFWENYPLQKWLEWTGVDEPKRLRAMTEMVVGHRMSDGAGGWVPWSDDDGDLPPCSELSLVERDVLEDDPQNPGGEKIRAKRMIEDALFWWRCPTDISSWIIAKVKEYNSALPNWVKTSSTTGAST